MLEPRKRSHLRALLFLQHLVFGLACLPSFGLAARLGGYPNPDIEQYSSGGSTLTMDLSPTLTAVFAFCIVFTILTFVQSWRTWLRIRQHNPQTRSIPYIILLIGTVLLFLQYILGAVYVSKELTRTSLQAQAIAASANSGNSASERAPGVLTDAFHAIRMFTDEGSDFFLYLSTFAVLHFRSCALLPAGTAGNHHPITWADFTVPARRLLFAGLTFFVFLVFIVVGSGLRGSWREVTETDGKQDIVIKAVFVVFQFYVAWAVVVGIFLEVVALSIWIFLGREKIHDSALVRIIPLLAFRSLLRLCTNIAESLPLNSPYVNSINYEIVMLVDVLVSGLIAALVMGSLISLGCPYSRAYPVAVPQDEPAPPPMVEVTPPNDSPSLLAMPEPELAPRPADVPDVSPLSPAASFPPPPVYPISIN